MKPFAFLTIVFALFLSCFIAFSGAILADESGSGSRLKERLQERKQDKTDNDATVKISKPGDYTFTVLHDSLTRKYRVHVPASYNTANPTPVLFALHGGGGNMDYQADDKKYGLISKSEQAGFIVVFPNGYSKFRGGTLATWNAGKCCGDARDKNIDDVGFIRKVVNRVSRQLNIDPRRIFATGMSNGGMMSYRLACEMPNVFKAVAPVAGTDNTVECKPAKPITVLHIHAQNDDHVLFNGGAGPNAFKDPSKVTEFTSVPSTIAKWLSIDGCPAKPQRVLEKADAYCELYSSCQNKTQVQLCVTEIGGHSWPGGNKSRSKELASQAISANDVMWEFFSRQ